MSVLKQSATNPWSTVAGDSCGAHETLTIQKVTDFIHVDFKIWNLLEKRTKKKFFVAVSKHKPRQSHMNNTRQHKYLDVEFKVFIHGKDVVENVLGNARNDAHLVRVVQLALKQESNEKGETVIDIQGQREEVIQCNHAFKFSENICLVKALVKQILVEPRRTNKMFNKI